MTPDEEQMFEHLAGRIELSDETERWAVEMELRDELTRAFEEYAEHTEIQPSGFALLFEVEHRTFRWRLAYRLARLASRIQADGAARGTM